MTSESTNASSPRSWPLTIQGAATLATALFAVYVFLVKERPLAAEERATVEAGLFWSGPTADGTCHAQLRMSLFNKGVKPFTVERTRVRAWLIEAPSGPVAEVDFVDMDALQRATPPVADVIYDIADARREDQIVPPMIARYAADMSYDATFEWRVPAEREEHFVARVDLYRRSGDALASWYTQHGSPVCGDRPVPVRSADAVH